MATTALSWVCFMNQHEQGTIRSFTRSWWFWLLSTGVSLGATISMKWVGLFTMCWVGSLALVQLWVLIGSPDDISLHLWFKHFAARLLCLLVIPLCLYISIFNLHFGYFTSPGESTTFMSPEFQATLNIKRPDTPANIVYGSHVSIRHWNTYGYLHSHNHLYVNGSKQQQVTAFPEKDPNNIWIIENQTTIISFGNISYLHSPNVGPTYIEDGAVIRLSHMSTNYYLHAQDITAPVTEENDEVSAYRQEGFEGNNNDLFRVEIDKTHSESIDAQARLRAIQSKFRLVHLGSGCLLHSHKVNLPNWGFNQQEVSCAHDNASTETIWYVEGNIHPFMHHTTERIN